MLIEKFTFQITHAIRAIGNIRNFQIVESVACLMYLPLAYIAFKMGYGAESIYWLAIIDGMLVACIRLYYGNIIAQIQVLQYIKSAVTPVIFPLIISFVLCMLLQNILAPSLSRVIIITIVDCVLFTLLFWFIGLNKDERNKWVGLLERLKK